MSTVVSPVPPGVVFPDSDGKPMSDNTKQYECIVTLKGNIEAVLPDTAFVAGDNLIYPDPTDPGVCQAPDVYVAFGRPRGHRGSYKVWEEGGIFPQVIFEVLSPSNTAAEMRRKRAFYEQHGADEYYEYDPDTGGWDGWVRDAATGRWAAVGMDGYTSPRVGIRFAVRDDLTVFRPDGSPFDSFQEIDRQRAAERRRAEAAERRAETERKKKEAERKQKEAAERRAAVERKQKEAAERQTAVERKQKEAAERRAEAEQKQKEAERERAVTAEMEAERLRALLRAAGIDPNASES
ncbi:Uma2 family endonuclease [Fimbriiglobus ruber]|uniref:Electron transport complex protein RnfC n=1 Tax=Fimbriiglobus ruber TaxID=1908690 RepID=A0A225DHW4_9BACT|nr:Uma2 family endonuclease [Fimbriiglobus ruber]OWK38138.1 Electron transport complex protein RnfC [Fimbriiglobus ruber]